MSLFEITKIKNDVNGNPRYVIHSDDIDFNYETAKQIARLSGFKKYRKKGTKHFVFSTYNVDDTLKTLKNNIIKIKKQ